jgi:hypothetical protein
MAEFLQSTADLLSGFEQVHGHFDQGQQHSATALDICMNLTANPWQGEASQKHMRLFQQIHDEFQTHINQGRHDVETAKTSVHAQGNHDQEL